MNKLTKLAAVLAVGLGSLAFASTNALAADVPAGTKLAAQQVLNYNFSEIGTIDPSLLQYTDDFSLGRMLFETLVKQDVHGDFVPAGATSWDVTPDGLTWTFHLRKDAKWSDGKPVTADQYLYSWQRLADPKTAAPYSEYLLYMNVENAKDVVSGRKPVSALGIKAVDPYTFQIKLTRPTPWLISMLPLTVTAPLRQDVIEKYGQSWTQPEHLVNNGPFNLQTYHINDILRVVKSNTYWDAKHTVITQINIDFITNPTANYYGFLTGKYLTSNIPPQFRQIVSQKYKEDITQVKVLGTYYMKVNSHVIPDVRARKALSLLIDRHILTNKIFKNNIPTTLLVPDNILGAKDIHEDTKLLNESTKDRRAEAIKLLDEAGYTPSHPLVIKYLTSSPQNNKIFVAIQNWYQRLSGGRIKISIEPAEGKVFYDRVNAKHYDITIGGWSADYPQVTTFLNVFTCTSGNNSTYFCNKDYDNLLQKASESSDPNERAELYAKAHKIVIDSYEYIPLWRSSFTYLKSPRLQGFNQNNLYRYFNDYYILAK